MLYEVITSLRKGPNFALSPDGGRIAYVLESDGQASLYVRDLDQPEGRQLLSGPILEHPFFSPDGQWIGFVTPQEMRKMPANGGTPIKLCAVDRARGARNNFV